MTLKSKLIYSAVATLSMLAAGCAMFDRGAGSDDSASAGAGRQGAPSADEPLRRGTPGLEVNRNYPAY